MKKGYYKQEGDTRRGTLQPTHEGLVYIEYESGGRVWQTPTIASIAVDRGEARKLDVSTEKKQQN